MLHFERERERGRERETERDRDRERQRGGGEESERERFIEWGGRMMRSSRDIFHFPSRTIHEYQDSRKKY